MAEQLQNINVGGVNYTVAGQSAGGLQAKLTLLQKAEYGGSYCLCVVTNRALTDDDVVATARYGKASNSRSNYSGYKGKLRNTASMWHISEHCTTRSLHDDVAIKNKLTLEKFDAKVKGWHYYLIKINDSPIFRAWAEDTGGGWIKNKDFVKPFYKNIDADSNRAKFYSITSNNRPQFAYYGITSLLLKFVAGIAVNGNILPFYFVVPINRGVHADCSTISIK